MRSSGRGGPEFRCVCGGKMEKGDVYSIRNIEDSNDNDRKCNLCNTTAKMRRNKEWLSCLSTGYKARLVHGDDINSGIDICEHCCDKLLQKIKYGEFHFKLKKFESFSVLKT